MLLGGAAFGSVAHAADDLVGDNQAILDYLAQVGGATLAEIFLATIITYLALLAAAYGIAATHRLHTEESDGRADLILATATSRPTWATSHLVQALAGSAAVLAAAAIGLGGTYAITTGDALDTLRVLRASSGLPPAVWVVVAAAMAVYGGAPRWSTGLWAFFTACTVIALFGDAFEIPQWIQDVSPFEHPGLAPAMSPQPLALAVLVGITVTTIGVGLWCFGRRGRVVAAGVATGRRVSRRRRGGGR